MSFPTLKDGSRDWCATCIHNYGDSCEFGERCMYQSNSVGTYDRDLPPTEYEEEMSMITPIEERLPHKVSEVICVKCGYRWISVRPEKTLLKDLECPKCGRGFVIETGEVCEEG